MKLFTYSEGRLSPGAVLPQSADTTQHKTCAININLPCDCDVDSFLRKLKGRDCADILLYGVVTLTEGDSVSSTCPEDSVLVVCEDPFRLDNFKNSCLEVTADEMCVSFLLYNGSELYDTESDKFIRNDNGKLKLEKESRLPEEEDENSDFVVTI